MIPATAHFIWFGSHFPWVNALAIRSAATLGGFERVVLHTDSDLSSTRAWPWLVQTSGFVHRPLDAEAIFGATGPSGAELYRLYTTLQAPAARANMVRAAILASEGGVYLDTDTVTVGSLDRLRAEAAAFCGLERIVLPYRVKSSQAPWIWAAAGLGLGVRDLCRRLPEGWRLFRLVEPLYPEAANNAVLASEPGHPFALELLQRMVDTPSERQKVRFALGTHLLQQAVAKNTRGDVVCHGPRVFYPLGPEISQHWFLPTQRVALDEVLFPQTRVVHWYASVRTKALVPHIDEGYVRRNRHHQRFSALACRVLES